MTNARTTRRALLTSIMSLILCCTMLLSTTYAWFTDSVTVSGNTIQAGTLDIALEMWDGTKWVNAEGKTLNFISANGETDILWEPGCNYQLPKLRVVNNGNLAAKFQVQVTGIAGDAKLNEVIDWYISYEAGSNMQRLKWKAFSELNQSFMVAPAGGTWGMNDDKLEFQFDGKMKTTAGNEYQGLKIEGVSITVLATQATYEYDSKNDQYDVNAEYALADGVYIQDDGSLKVVSQEALSNVAELASKDDSITSVTYNGAEVPVVRDTASMNAELAEGETTIVLTEGTYTVGAAAGKTVTIAGTEDTKVDITSGLTYVRGANVTFEGLTIQSAPEGAGYTNGLADATYTVFNNCVINGTLGLDYSCEFNNCEFNIEGDFYNVWTWGAGTASFTDCTFNCEGKALLVYANVLDNGTSHQTVKITNCVFNDNGDDSVTGKAAIEITDTYPANNITYDVIINNTTVNGFSTTEQNATTFGGTDLGTNVWGNKNLLTTDDLNVVIDGVDVH